MWCSLRYSEWVRLRANGVSKEKAITALAHKPARIIYNLMRYGLAYMRETEEADAAQVLARREKGLQRRAKKLGYELKKIAPSAEQPAAV